MWIVINLKWFRCPSGFNEHSGHPAPSPFSTANGVFPRKSPPISTQNPNHMTSHVTSLPSSIGRLSLGLASHFAASPIPEQDDNIHSPVGSSKYNQCDFCLPTSMNDNQHFVRQVVSSLALCTRLGVMCVAYPRNFTHEPLCTSICRFSFFFVQMLLSWEV